MGGRGFGRGAKALAAASLAVTLGWSASAHARRVVYINTEPTALVDTNGQDPTTNSYSSGGFTPGMISGWPALTEEQKQLLLFHLKQAAVPFDIEFVLDRPAQGTYDMVVMGSDTDAAALFEGLGCSAAIGLADCDDASAENISFLFWGCMAEDQQQDMRRVAFNSLAGLGFGWGLENLAVSGQVMGSYTVTALKFGTECSPISGTSQCGHEGCAAAEQNSSADLMARIGARVDDGPPSVTIDTPANLSDVEPDIAVGATVEDVFGGLEVTLEVVEAAQMLTDTEPPYHWELSGVPSGMWTLRVTAIDADLNETSEEVIVCVDVPECGVGPTDDTGGGTGGADTTSGGDTSGGVEPTSTSGASGIDPTGPPPGTGGLGPAGANKACHCRTDTEPTPILWGLVVVGIAATRRRRVTRAG